MSVLASRKKSPKEMEIGKELGFHYRSKNTSCTPHYVQGGVFG